MFLRPRHLTPILTISVLVGMSSLFYTFGINISPSKPQGGNTNNIPYKSDSSSPSLLGNPVRWIFGPERSEAMKRVSAPPNFKVDLNMEPKNYVPAPESVLKARMVLVNQSKEKYMLEFNTAQRYEFIIKDSKDKEVFRSSSDKVFSQQLSSTVVNRNEKLVYEEELFSPSNQVIKLPPGQYKLVGQVTSKEPISVETTFQVSR
jgi:hypothetical protein